MTRRRWIADRVEGDRAYLLGPNANHLFRVLRARAGQQFDVAAHGVLRRGTIIEAKMEQVEFQLGEEVPSTVLPHIKVYLSIFKFDRLEWALEKLTELGVSSIVPVIAQRTEKHLVKAAGKRVERWRKLAREASQQARRVAPPEIADPLTLKKAIADEQTGRIVLSEEEERVSLRSLLADSKLPLALAFGPEGGWSPAELTMFNDHAWQAASLGHTILRAETAAIAAAAVAIAELQSDLL
ncbi:MAG TPA: RsmE family RNA methyltransferase [Candidatus Sulfotelmatobacter sp.]|nr:RsmE family RNA methyltransferase [Candidatus Sulfotelmatobacter sp.]